MDDNIRRLKDAIEQLSRGASFQSVKDALTNAYFTLCEVVDDADADERLRTLFAGDQSSGPYLTLHQRNVLAAHLMHNCREWKVLKGLPAN